MELTDFSTPRPTAPAAAASAGDTQDEAELLFGGVQDQHARGEQAQDKGYLRAVASAAVRAGRDTWRRIAPSPAEVLKAACFLTVLLASGVVIGIISMGAHHSHTTSTSCSEVGCDPITLTLTLILT